MIPPKLPNSDQKWCISEHRGVLRLCGRRYQISRLLSGFCWINRWRRRLGFRPCERALPPLFVLAVLLVGMRGMPAETQEQQGEATRTVARQAWGTHWFANLNIEIRKHGGGGVVTVYGPRQVLLSRRVFRAEEFEAVGGYSGLWVPATQPLTNAFTLHKFGAYAGRTLLVLREGRLLEFAGGFYSYDRRAKRLLLYEDTDIEPLYTALDENERVICACTRSQDLRDAAGKQIIVPREFICLPELAEESRRKRNVTSRK